MRRQAFAVLSAACLVFVLIGCASAPMAVPQLDQKAKTFAPVADKAVVYIYRNETLGAALSMDVSIDDKSLGNTVSKSFFRVEIEPGTHKIVSQGDKDKALDLKVEADKVYFVWQEVKMGFMSGGSQLQIVPEAKGHEGVNECTLLDSPASPAK